MIVDSHNLRGGKLSLLTKLKLRAEQVEFNALEISSIHPISTSLQIAISSSHIFKVNVCNKGQTNLQSVE